MTTTTNKQTSTIAANIPADLAEAMRTVQAIRRELNERFLERSAEIDALLTCLIAGQHVALLGAKGEAKSALTRALAARLANMPYFQTILDAFSQPEELFGPLSMEGLERDEYRRKTAGWLPEARFAFLDEAFKGNTAILNALLLILNERLFKQDGQLVPAKLEFAVFASNEMPQPENRAALWDRVTLRLEVNQLSDAATEAFFDAELVRRTQRAKDQDMLGLSVDGRSGTVLTDAQLTLLQTASLRVHISPIAREAFFKIRTAIKAKLGFTPSTRRVGWLIGIMAAHAILSGRMEVTESDMLPLQHGLWEELEHRRAVREIVLACANPLMNQVITLADLARAAHKTALKAFNTKPNDNPQSAVAPNPRTTANTVDPRIGALMNARAQIQTYGESIKDLIVQMEDAGRDANEAKAIYEEVDGLRRDIAATARKPTDSPYSW